MATEAQRKSAKEEVRELLNELPDDTSLADIQYHLYVRQKVHRGLDDVKAGRTVSAQAVQERLARWLEP